MEGRLEGQNGGRKRGLLMFAAGMIWTVALSGTGSGGGLSVLPLSPSAEPYVASTLVLLNNTLIPGHFVAANGLGPVGVAYDSDKGEVFVASYSRNTVSVISDGTHAVIATIPGCNGDPCGLAYDAGRGEVFVTNFNADTVSVISDTTNTVVANISVGRNPFGIAYNAAKAEIFVANSGSNNVSVISDSTNTVVASVPVGFDPRGVAYDAGRGEIHVVNGDSDSVSVISDS